MTLWTIIAAIAAVAVTVTDAKCTTCININNICHNVSYLFDLQANFRNTIVIPKMGILRSKNMLLYNYEPSIDDIEYYKVGFVNLEKPEIVGVIGNNNNFTLNFGTFDVDQENDAIYLGGSDGIYILETNNRLAKIKNGTATTVFFKDVLYYVDESDNKFIIKGTNETFLEHRAPIKNFVIDKNDVVVLLSTYGLFVSKGNSTISVSKNAFFRGLTVDLDGIVYAWWVDGIYKLTIANELINSYITMVAHVPKLDAMTFDNENNILVTSDKGLFMLIKTEEKSC